MNKIDAIIAFGIGALTGLYFFDFLRNAKNALTAEFVVPEPFYALLWTIILAFPILAGIALWVASLIGKKYLAIYQLAKFLLVGVLATIFDLGTLSLFITWSGIASGAGYIVFKGISFLISTILKYIPDKYWAFKKKESANVKKEFIQFFSVTVAGLIINLSIAAIIVNLIGPQFDIDKDTWAKIGGIGATIITFTWNFIGYKFIVFKK